MSPYRTREESRPESWWRRLKGERLTMAYTVAEFALRDLGERPKCVDCNGELSDATEGARQCAECHYDDISAVIEKHPIGLPCAMRLL